MVVERCGRNHIVYILMKQYKLAHWVGCRKIHWNTMTVCMQRPNGQYHYSAKLLSNKSSNCYSNAFKKHWNNSGTICFLKVILRTKKQVWNYAENALCYKFFFWGLGQNSQNSYFIKLSLMYAKRNPVEYSPGDVFNS